MNLHQWQLLNLSNNLPVMFNGPQIIIGRSQTCNIPLNKPYISPIHISLTILSDGTVLFNDLDMSHSIVKINDQQTKEKILVENDTISVGEYRFILKKIKEGELEASPKKDLDNDTITIYLSHLKNKREKEKKTDNNENQSILNLNPNLVFTKYIYEDKDNIFPIFKRPKNQESFEVITSLYNTPLSIKYLDCLPGKFYFTGRNSYKKNAVTIPALKKREKKTFAIYDGEKASAQEIKDVPLKIIDPYIQNNPNINSEKEITSTAIACYSINNYKIFVRKVKTGPEIIPPPFFGRDKRYPLIFIPFLIFGVIFQLLIFNIKVNKEEIEIKAPERIAKILRKPSPKVSTSPTVAATPTPQVEQKPVAQKSTEEKKAEPKSEKKVPKTKTTEKISKTVAPIAEKKMTKPTPPPPPVVPKFSDKFSSMFKSKIAASNAENSKSTPNPSVLTLRGSGSSRGINTGKLSEAQVIEDSGKGAKHKGEYSAGGLVGDKKGLDFDSVSYRTVVLGSIDPLIVKKIIQEQIPEMTFCYEQSLATENAESLPAGAFMEFTIGATGHILSAKVIYKDKKLPPKAHQCLLTVIKSMKFPAPKGGGFVNVRQPINFLR